MPPRIHLPQALKPLNVPQGTRSVTKTHFNAQPRTFRNRVLPQDRVGSQVSDRPANATHHAGHTNAAASILGLDERKSRLGTGSATESIRGTLRAVAERAGARHPSQRMLELTERMRKQKVSDEHFAFMPRPWQVGDVYAPHDLSAAEMRKWGRFRQQDRDIVDRLGVDPKDFYKVRPFSPLSRWRGRRMERRWVLTRSDRTSPSSLSL